VFEFKLMFEFICLVVFKIRKLFSFHLFSYNSVLARFAPKPNVLGLLPPLGFPGLARLHRSFQPSSRPSRNRAAPQPAAPSGPARPIVRTHRRSG
jgi:hypothetical protein